MAKRTDAVTYRGHGDRLKLVSIFKGGTGLPEGLVLFFFQTWQVFENMVIVTEF